MIIEIAIYLIHEVYTPLLELFVPFFVGLVVVMTIIVIAIQVFLFK